jgi:predicted transcriptional regulator
MPDNTVKKIQKILKRNADGGLIDRGLTITGLVNSSKLTRSAIRIALAKLEGAEKVKIKQVGMAKVYYSVEGENEK